MSNATNIIIPESTLKQMLVEAAEYGAKRFMDDMAVYSYSEAAKLLKMSSVTLRKRIHEGKIKQVDGKVTGQEIRRYLDLSE